MPGAQVSVRPGAGPQASPALRRQGLRLHYREAEIGQRIDALPFDDGLCMSFVTYAELRKGAERSTRKPDVLRRLDQLTRHIPVSYPSDAAICRHYAEHFTRLKSAGTPICANDPWIGCQALAEDAVLVTNNDREFRRLNGLRVENWAV